MTGFWRWLTGRDGAATAEWVEGTPPPLGVLATLPVVAAPALLIASAPPDRRTLRPVDYAEAAEALGCTVAAVRAVAAVESSGGGFLPDGRPKVLYEAHVFHRLTKGRHAARLDRAGVRLSVPAWDRGLYGAGGAHQHERLADAAALDVDAAIRATSWGEFQVLGDNLGMMEVPGMTPREWVLWMGQGAGAHLQAFVRYVRACGLADELRRLDWAGFARGYNGPGYATNGYDTKMAAAYARERAAA